LSFLVIAGLDPAIHHFEQRLFFTMDARVKPAHEDSDIDILKQKGPGKTEASGNRGHQIRSA
jgi:hypothetical protein